MAYILVYAILKPYKPIFLQFFYIPKVLVFCI